ncbi:ATP-dependent Clp protease proteolytic subunit [Candidatus Kaiserbacteria bacterium]|nr:ATP-dependent Clp protease proteolytic subunit [Candidatus Kaiserbacteria bacterium]
MKFVNSAKDEIRNEVTISVTGEIGWDFRGGDLINYLRAWHENTERVNLDFFSFGGSAFDAIAVYEFLTTNGYNNVNANIYGFCGSAATIIACAAQTVNMGQHSFFFVHNAFNGETGEPDENSQKVSEQIAAIYKKKTKLDIRTIRKLMNEGDQGALLDATQAKEYGFVDAILKEKMSLAAAFRQRFDAKEPTGAATFPNTKNSTMEFKLMEWVRSAFNAEVSNEEEAQKFLQEKAPAIIQASAEPGAVVSEQKQRIDALEAAVQKLDQEAAKGAQVTELQNGLTAVLEQVTQLAQAVKESQQSVQANAQQAQVQESDFQKKMRELAEAVQAMKTFPASPAAATAEGVPAVAAQVQAATNNPNVVVSSAFDTVHAKMIGKEKQN